MTLSREGPLTSNRSGDRLEAHRHLGEAHRGTNLGAAGEAPLPGTGQRPVRSPQTLDFCQC